MMITFSILPVIVVYLILSKHIVGGVAMGSVKLIQTLTKTIFFYIFPFILKGPLIRAVLFCEQNGRRFVYPLLTEYVIL